MSDGGAQFKEWGGFWDNTNSVVFTSIWIKAYDAGSSFATPKTFWTDEGKTAAVTERQGSTTGKVSGYFDGDYDIEILESDKSTVIKQYPNVKITSDTGGIWKGEWGTAQPATSAKAKGHRFTTIDGSANVVEFAISNGASWTTVMNWTTGGVPFLDNIITKIMPVANVKHGDYGAIGDGSTDDRQAIQDAIDEVEGEGGGIVWIPEGTYKIGTPGLDIGAVAGNVILMGVGNSSILKTDHVSSNILSLGDGSTTRSGITVRDLKFTSSVTRSGGAAIDLNKVSLCTLENINIASENTGITTSATNTIVRMNNIDIRETIQTNGIGMFLNHGNDYYIKNVVMDAASDPFAGIRLGNVGNVWMSDTHLLNSGHGLYINPDAGEVASDIFLTNCKVQSCDQNGIFINADTATSTARKIKISGGIMDGNTKNGIRITGHASSTIDDIDIDNVGVYGNGEHGISLEVGVNVSINGCKISGNDSGDSSTYDGVSVNAGITQFQITNNFIGTMGGESNYQVYGIDIGSGAGNEFIITGNSIINNKTGSIRDQSTGANQHFIKDNLYDVIPTISLISIPSGTTVAIPASGEDFTITGSVQIDNFANGYTKRLIILRFAASVVVRDTSTSGGNIKLDTSANWSATVDDMLMLQYEGSFWHEISRSVN
jgi:hypothetical protein